MEVSVTAESYQALILHKSMFSTPCKCCAARDHGLLKTTHTEVGRKIPIFDCPVTNRNNVTELIEETQSNKKYRPCPEKFAYHFGCQEDSVRIALKPFDDYGAGKYLNGHEFTEFSTKAINTCKWYRSMNTFKREVTLHYDYADETLQSDPEEEESQDTKA